MYHFLCKRSEILWFPFEKTILDACKSALWLVRFSGGYVIKFVFRVGSKKVCWHTNMRVKNAKALCFFLSSSPRYFSFSISDCLDWIFLLHLVGNFSLSHDSLDLSASSLINSASIRIRTNSFYFDLLNMISLLPLRYVVWQLTLVFFPF